MLHKLLTLLTPDNCLDCGVEGPLLCGVCMPKHVSSVPSRCFFCFTTTKEDACCRNCRESTGISTVRTCGKYEGALKDIVYSYKFEHNRAACDVLARLLLDRESFLPEGAVFTYIPTVHKHVRERGFDHAKLLAKTLAKKHQRVAIRLLERRTQTTQLGSTRATRMKNMANAFEPRPRYTLQGQHVIIVDDVITTGATIKAAARSLKAAGASKITVLAVAKA